MDEGWTINSTTSRIILDDHGNVLKGDSLADTLWLDVILLVTDVNCVLFHRPTVVFAERSDLEILDRVVVQDLFEEGATDVLVRYLQK